MTESNITYEIINIVETPDGNKQVSLQISKTEPTSINPTEEDAAMATSTISFSTNLIVLATEVVEDKINEFLKTNPI